MILVADPIYIYRAIQILTSLREMQMTASCPVEECSEVKEVKASLRRWSSLIIVVVLTVGGAALYTWANARRIPDIEAQIKQDHDKLIIQGVNQVNILKNTEDIKLLIQAHLDKGDR
jgi:hypothetical protein